MSKHFKIAKTFLLAITMVNLDDMSKITKIDVYSPSILIFIKKKQKYIKKYYHLFIKLVKAICTIFKCINILLFGLYNIF